LNEKYGQDFGFLEEEVKSILPTDGSIPIKPICEWYNGYQIGKYRVYNPWSIINCIDNNGILSPYWVNTSDNALVYRMIEHAKPSVKIRFEELIQGKTQRQELTDNLTFGYLENDENAIWTLLVHTGYLNVVSSEIDDNGQLFATIAIPNKEVMSIYVQMVKKWFMLSNQASNYYNELLATIEQGDINGFKEHIAEYIRESGSYFDFSKNTPERVFHVFMLGLLVGLRGKYEISSNKEAGNGRYDIIFIPKNPQQRGIILEFKTIDKAELLSTKAQEALEQIKNKEYFLIFKQHSVKSVLAIGMAFCGKQVEATHENLDVVSYL
jgi:hypothetical protein